MTAASAPELLGEGHGINKTYRAHGQTLANAAFADERHVKPLSIVGDERGVSHKLRKVYQSLLHPRCVLDLGMADPRVSLDEWRDVMMRTHEGGKMIIFQNTA